MAGLGITVRADFTPNGEARLRQIRLDVEKNIRKEIVRLMKKVKGIAAQIAPSPTEEAKMLSAGVPVDGPKAGVEAGKPEGGRFFRDGVLMPMREAIIRSAESLYEEDGAILISGASAQWINNRTG